MKQRNRALGSAALLAGALFVSTTAAYADGVTDYYYQFNQQRYFDAPQNARTFGMAGSTVATSSDSSSVVGNPAGLGFMKDAEVSGTYAREYVSGNDMANYANIEQTLDSGQGLIALPLDPTLGGLPNLGNLGLGWSGYKGKTDDVADTHTDGYRLHAAYAKALNDMWSLGYSFTYDHDKVNEKAIGYEYKMTDGVRQELGAQYKASKETTYGATAFYGFGSPDNKIAGNTVSEDIHSLGLGAGVQHSLNENTLLAFSTDYTNYNTNLGDDMYAWEFRTGVEQTFNNWLKGRLGYRYAANMNYDARGNGNDDNAKFNGFSAGVGVELAKNLRADYGVEYRSLGDGGDWSHLVTVSVPFSLCEDSK